MAASGSQLARHGGIEADMAGRAGVPDFLCAPLIHRPSPQLFKPLFSEVRTALRAAQAIPEQQPAYPEEHNDAADPRNFLLASGQLIIETDNDTPRDGWHPGCAYE